MKIIDKFEAPTAIFYSVEIAPNRFVDVKRYQDHPEFKNLIYVMQNPDGTTVYDDQGITHPRFSYGIQEILLLCINESEV